jgi:hypothetical protein
MQRGIIELSIEEQQILRRALENTPLQQTDTIKKFDTTMDNQTTLELSRDEAESILDNLPIPSPAEPADLTTARRAVAHFLTSI